MCRNISTQDNEENTMKLKKIMLLAAMVALPSVGLSVEENQSQNNDKTYTEDEVENFLNTNEDKTFVNCYIGEEYPKIDIHLNYIKVQQETRAMGVHIEEHPYYRVLGKSFETIKKAHNNVNLDGCVKFKLSKEKFLTHPYVCIAPQDAKDSSHNNIFILEDVYKSNHSNQFTVIPEKYIFSKKYAEDSLKCFKKELIKKSQIIKNNK
jgi:hypothetical protein